MNFNNDARCDVLFLIRSMGRGGAERQLSLLARALHARGLRVAVAVFYAGGTLESELHASGVDVVDLRKRGRWSNLGMLRRLMAEVRQRKPRVLHAYMPTQNIIALLLRPWLHRQGCRVVCGVRAAKLTLNDYGLLSYGISTVHGVLVAGADRVISNASRSLDQLSSSIRADRGVVIPNGVHAERFEYAHGRRISQRTQWEVTGNHVLVGLVGRLHPEKNHGLLLDAIAMAGSALDDVMLVFVGEGAQAYREMVAERARTLGLESRIVWAGASDDMSAVYSALDVLCLCSVSEGFPNVLGEAMSAGLPCVSTDVGDATVLLGDCGWVVPSGDTSELANALVAACKALPTWDRSRPRRRIEAEFSVDALADRTLAALAPFLCDGAR